MTHQRLRPAFSFDEERITALRGIAPEVFADGKINWQTLHDSLGGVLEEEGVEKEHFGLFWPGKREVRRLAAIYSKGTLVPCLGKGINEDSTHNIYIEGENLEVLKLLQNSYAAKIKMIYIDPPYNTGNDFVYDDDYSEPLEEYLLRTGQIDKEGKPLSTLKRSDGRFHSKWLSMMYPRLRLALKLLRDDGLIFISIDENELANLISIMRELFGEENFEGLISWRRRHNQPNDKTKMIGKVCEYIVAFAKNSIVYKERGVGKIGLTGVFSNPDNDPRGDWASKPWKVGTGQSGTKYKIKTPSGKTLDAEWMGDQETYDKLFADSRIIFPKKGDGSPRKKYFKFEREEEGQCATNWWNHDNFGHNQGASDEIAKLFGEKNIFSNPKPTLLMKNLLQIANVRNNDIVLDFFAGSGSLADAVYQVNKEEKGKVSFILVQYPEKLDPADDSGRVAIRHGYKTISDICFARIKKASKEYRSKDHDYGCKMFKLARSNYKNWNPGTKNDISTLEGQFDAFVDPLNDDWSKEALLAEILLIEKFPLDSSINKLDKCSKNDVVSVSTNFCEHKLIVCLDKKLYKDTITQLELNENDIFVCLDNAINDDDKVRLTDKGLLKTI